MKTLILFFALLIISISSYGQEPVFITDFNEGPEDAFLSNERSYSHIQLGEKFILPVFTEDNGEELGIIENNEIKIIKDIVPGVESSGPVNLTLYKGKVYFGAEDEDGDGGLWVTDGTEDGTQQIFKVMGSNYYFPEGMLVSKSDTLYYTYEFDLYQFDGEENKMIRESVAFKTAFVEAADNYCLYKDGIAFIEEVGGFDAAYQLVLLQNGEFIEVGTTSEISFFAEAWGLSEVSNGLIFAVDGGGNSAGSYKFIEGEEGISKLMIDGSTDAPARLFNVSDSITIAQVRDKGYFALNGKDNEEFMIYEAADVSWSQGQIFPTINYGDKFIMHMPEGDFFNETNNLIYSDGTLEGSKVLFELSKFNSNVVSSEQFAYIASDVSNGFSPYLYEINMENGNHRLVKKFEEPSLSLTSIHNLGVIDNKLYYISNLNGEVGRELYYLQLEEPSSLQSPPNLPFDVQIHGESFEVISTELNILDVKIYTIDGQLVETLTVETNAKYDISHLTGTNILSLLANGQLNSYKYIAPK